MAFLTKSFRVGLSIKPRLLLWLYAMWAAESTLLTYEEDLLSLFKGRNDGKCAYSSIGQTPCKETSFNVGN